MIQKTLEVPIEEGTVKGRYFRPDGSGPWPLVVFYMDAFGLRPALTRMAEHLVEEGYAVLQPDLYWRSEPYESFDPGSTFSDAEERERIMTLIHSVDPEDVVADTLLLVETLEEDEAVEAESWASVGYCMGGRIALLVAEEIPTRIPAVASIHGGGLVGDGPESPHRKVSRITGSVYVGVADEDRSCTPEDQRILRDALEDAGVDFEMEVYSGARHGFAVPDLPVHDPDAADRHWDRVLSLFDATLKTGSS